MLRSVPNADAHTPHSHGLGTAAFFVSVVAIAALAAFGGDAGPNSIEYNETRLLFLLPIAIAGVGSYYANECDSARRLAARSSVRTTTWRGLADAAAPV